MSISWFITNLLAAFLLPPLLIVLAVLIGWRVSQRYRRTGRALVLLALGALIVLSTEAGSRLVVSPLEARALPIVDPMTSGAQAIVILGGGRTYAAPEDAGRDQPSSQTLVRLRHGARLYRQRSLPVLVTGGAPDVRGESEAALMARALQEDFQVPVRWREETSDNTAQNALHSAAILREAGITRVLLVTDAVHMPRAQQMFARAGLQVVPAPTAFFAQKELSLADVIPQAAKLKTSSYAMHEWIGLLWYQIRHR